MNCLARGFLVAILLVGVGCSGKDDRPKPGKDQKDKHDHPDKGPNDGVLVEWGEEEYHIEFVPDHKKKTATAYVLGPDAKTAVPIDAESLKLVITSFKPPVEIDLKPEPQDKEPKGKSSRFTGKHDKLGEEMNYKGKISGKAGGKPYSGDFDEKEHDHK